MIEDLKKELNELKIQKKVLEDKIYDIENRINALSKFKIILKDSIYIDIKNISSNIIQELKQLSSFENPQINLFKKLKKPTHYLPKHIISWSIEDTNLILPRGLMRYVIKIFKLNNIEFEIDDKRFYKQIEVKSIKFPPKPNQIEAIKNIIKKDFGICVAYPGFGKTYIASNIIKQRAVNTLVVVNKNMLLNQWVDRFCDYFGYKKDEIGILGKGKNSLTNIIDIATIQSLKNQKDIVKNYSFLIVDECHHIPANSFEDVVKEFEGRYILGLSATPNRKDSMEPLLYFQLGQIVFEAKKEAKSKHIVNIVTTNFTSDSDNWNDIISEIITNKQRNELIIKQIEKYKNRKILLLTDRVEHINILKDMLDDKNIKYLDIYGGMSDKQKQNKIKNIKNSSLIIATTSYFGEGVDFNFLDTIILATPISYHGRLIQYLGRIGRDKKNIDTIAIDILDNKNNFTISAFKKRKLGYKELHYKIVQQNYSI